MKRLLALALTCAALSVPAAATAVPAAPDSGTHRAAKQDESWQ